jgi:preprotein translocase subunit YajC
MQSQLDVGDEIITNSGMYGFITGFDDDRVWVEIDDDVQVRLARAAIQGKVDTSSGPASSPPLTRPEREAERNTEATEQAADDTADSE